jgi:hypothetical protein
LKDQRGKGKGTNGSSSSGRMRRRRRMSRFSRRPKGLRVFKYELFSVSKRCHKKTIFDENILPEDLIISRIFQVTVTRVEIAMIAA